MKKMIGTILVLILLVTAVVLVIRLQKQQIETLDFVEDGNAYLRLDMKTLTRQGATFVIGNYETQGVPQPEIKYNQNYRIEVKKEGKWSEVQLAKNAPKQEEGKIRQKQYYEEEEWVDWSNRYGTLPNGEYRYVKWLEIDGKKVKLASDFTIVDSTIQSRNNRQYEKVEKLSLTVQKETIRRTEMSIVLQSEIVSFFSQVLEDNETSYTYPGLFENLYWIEYKKDGVWTAYPQLPGVEREPEDATESGLVPDRKQNTLTAKVIWKNRYGELPNGEYRYVKYCNGSQYNYVEFVIDDTVPKEEKAEKATDISAKIKEGTLTRTSATLEITDKRNSEAIWYSNGYWIEKKNYLGNWEMLKRKIMQPEFIERSYHSASKGNTQTTTKEVKWSDELEKGTYRYVEEIEENKTGKKQYYVVEFEIAEDTISSIADLPIEQKQATDVSMKIKEGTLTKTSATFVITDKRDLSRAWRIDYYTIEKKNETGAWEKLQEKGKPSIALKMEKVQSEVSEKTIDWTEKYGALPAGTYRLVMEDGNSKYFWVDFTIQNETTEDIMVVH